jgi:hypothetical protein
MDDDDEATSAALNGVAARLPAPFRRPDVFFNIRGAQPFEPNAGLHESLGAATIRRVDDHGGGDPMSRS